MKPVLLSILAALLAVSGNAEPVINEINYRPGSAYPENTRLEFIEVYNPDSVPADIGGWQLTSGVSYTIPAGTILAPRGYRVIAADPAALQAAHPGLTAVLGPWTAGATLSNKGEKISLSRPDPAAPATLIGVDDVTYADEGDWAIRTRDLGSGGWTWVSLANSGNRTLELRNAALPNGNGQNWGVSSNPGGTPGAANSQANANIAPIISDVKNAPAVPRPGQTVRISCTLTDESVATALSAQLFWRNATSTSPGAFAVLPMTGDGSGEFAATLPSQVNRTIIEFYISANDGPNVRTWPAATNEGQTANALYQVDDAATDVDDAVYRLILTANEEAAFVNVPSSSNRQFNCTLVATRGNENTIRYRTSMRIRGNSSRNYVYKPLRISIPSDDPWDGVSSFNLNPKYPYLQYIGMRIMQAAGLPASDAIPVELRRNGIESTQGGAQAQDFGKWARVEDYNSDFVDRHFPTADGGNIYQKGRPDEFWRSTAGAPSNPDDVLDGFTKQNNSAANDWSDLTNFFSVWQTNSAPHFPGASPGDVDTGNWAGTAFNATQLANVGNVADLDQWARWFAAMTLLEDGETNISNGQDDDYVIYIAPDAVGNRRVVLLPHDFDTILGRGDQNAITSPTGRGLYDATAENSIFKPLLPLLGNSPTTGNAEFRTKYFNAIRELCGGVLNADTTGNPNPPFYQFVDYHLGRWLDTGAAAAARTGIKTFMTQRQAYLLGLIGSPAITPTPPTSLSTLPGTAGSVVINEVLANNVSAQANAGTFPDIIELLNTTGAPIDISGYGLSDDPLAPSKYLLPPGTTIAAGGTLVLYADFDVTGAGLHTGFQLDKDGDAIFLFNATSVQIDTVSFGPQAADFSIGRVGAAPGTWSLCTPTIGVGTNAAAALGNIAGVRINEWASNADFRINGDFIELYNPATQPVAIGGARLTDEPIAFPARHVLPALSFMGPQSWLVFRALGKSATVLNPTELPFSVDSTFGSLSFAGANGSVIDTVDIVSQFHDESTGRAPDGTTTLAPFGRADDSGTVLTNLPTPGTANVAPTANQLALINDLRITEINYKPVDGNDYEFIELQNTGTVTLDLAGVRFSNGIDYVFPSGTMLAAREYIVVCRNRTTFLSRYPSAANALAPGQYTGNLDNNGEAIALSLPNPFDVAILNFRYKTTWQPLTFNNGHTLTVIAPATTNPGDWKEPETWTASAAPGGTPGTAGPPVITSPLTLSGVQGAPLGYQIVASNSPTSFSATGLPTGTAFDPNTGIISGTPTVFGTFAVAIGAAGATGSDSKTLNITIAQQPSPVITSTLAASATITGTFTYRITASNSPTSFNATGLPAWLTFNAATATLSGLPPAVGTASVTISATNLGGTDVKTLVITISADPFAGALDGFGLGYTTGGLANWLVQTAITHDGVDAARSGDVNDDGETYLQTIVNGPDRLRFWWRVSSEGSFDYLNFLVDGVTIQGISGEVNWAQIIYDIPAGSHTIRWNYTKDGSVSTGADAGFLDEVRLDSQTTEPIITSALAVTATQDEFFSYQIVATQNPQSFTAAPLPAGLTLDSKGLLSGVLTASNPLTVNISATGPSGTAAGQLSIMLAPSPTALASAAEGVGLQWSHALPSNAFWFNQSGVTHDGVDAAQSGDVANNGESRFQIQITGPGTLTFWWRVSSDPGDALGYTLNGNAVADIRGETVWAQRTLPIPAGANTVVFSYTKDGGGSSGADAGWVDQIVFAPTDIDGDGLADSWEQAHFGNLNQTAQGDPDADGYSNANEYRFGTAPNSAASKTGITNIIRNPDGSATIDWRAVPGRIYGFEWSTDLTTWNALPGKISANAPLMRATVAPAPNSVLLVAENANAYALGPASDIGTNWRGGNEPAFLAGGGYTGWLTGQQGVGYENDPVPSGNNFPYTPFLGLDVSSQTVNAAPQRSSVYIRIPFTVTDPTRFISMQLGVRFDDGFAAWINGNPLANDNAPVSPTWNATTSNRGDAAGAVYATYDVTAKLPFLHAGENILSIQGINTTPGSSDLLVQAVLSASAPAVSTAGPRFFWRITAE